MNKFFLGIIGTILFVLVIGMIYVFLRTPDDTIFPIDGGTTTFPTDGNTGGSNGTQGDGTIKIRGVSNSMITVKNFLEDPETVKDAVNEGYFYLGNHFSPTETTSAQNPAYVILYIAETQYFNVGLFREPIGKSRLDAEQYLMNHLGIAREGLCALNYMVSVPTYVNEYYASVNLGFSACSDSVPLP